MKKNINLKAIIIALIMGVFSICLIKQLTVLRRIKNDITNDITNTVCNLYYL